MNEDSKCPVTGGAKNPIAGGGTSNRDWWPESVEPQDSSSELSHEQSDGRGVQLR